MGKNLAFEVTMCYSKLIWAERLFLVNHDKETAAKKDLATSWKDAKTEAQTTMAFL